VRGRGRFVLIFYDMDCRSFFNFVLYIFYHIPGSV
jgi:hypothetical protein